MVSFFILQLRTSWTYIQDRQIKKEVCGLSTIIVINNSVNQAQLKTQDVAKRKKHRARKVQRVLLGGLGNNDDDNSENITEKMN